MSEGGQKLQTSSYKINKSCNVQPFHTAHGILKAIRLKWFAIPFSTGPCFVRTLYHDPSILGGPTKHGS